MDKLTPLTPLTPCEQWMVLSNLETIRTTGVTASEQAALLRANGYHRIAQAVEEAAKPVHVVDIPNLVLNPPKENRHD